MRIIVVGGGEIGSRLAKFLSEEKHDIVVIEKDTNLCQELADNLNAMVIHGDGTKSDVLKEAGIKKTDALVAVTGTDEANLLTCLVAKEISKDIRMIARTTKDEYKKIFLKIGVSSIVSPETSTVEQLENMIVEPDVADLAIMHKGLVELVEFEVNEKSKVAGKSIKKIEFPKESLVVAIKRTGNFLIPEETERLRGGDRVIIVVKKTLEKKIRDMFKS
ncbi:potassium channel family protein [Candidatus Aenigmatarchaeota archaeon]